MADSERPASALRVKSLFRGAMGRERDRDMEVGGGEMETGRGEGERGRERMGER